MGEGEVSNCGISFNPRPRAGGDYTPDMAFVSEYYVSIHAPARGATTAIAYDSVYAVVSIHAPARGATRYPVESYQQGRFQSTPPRGGRHAMGNRCAVRR